MSRYHINELEEFVTNNVSRSTRTIYMGSCSDDEYGNESGVDSHLAEYMIKGLHFLDNYGTNAKEGKDPITIIMNNIGGDEYHGLAIFDAIQLCKNPIQIQVFGHAMSMGSIILQAAENRLISPNARMMIHYGTWGMTDHAPSARNWSNEGEKVNKWMEDLYLKRIRKKHPSFTRKKLKDMLMADTILNAKEAVNLNLADEVLDLYHNI